MLKTGQHSVLWPLGVNETQSLYKGVYSLIRDGNHTHKDTSRATSSALHQEDTKCDQRERAFISVI